MNDCRLCYRGYNRNLTQKKYHNKATKWKHQQSNENKEKKHRKEKLIKTVKDFNLNNYTRTDENELNKERFSLFSSFFVKIARMYIKIVRLYEFHFSIVCSSHYVTNESVWNILILIPISMHFSYSRHFCLNENINTIHSFSKAITLPSASKNL